MITDITATLVAFGLIAAVIFVLFKCIKSDSDD